MWVDHTVVFLFYFVISTSISGECTQPNHKSVKWKTHNRSHLSYPSACTRLLSAVYFPSWFFMG